MVRVQELRESQKIVVQALEGLPEGRIKADAPKVVLPDREKMKTEMEALIYHFKIVTEGFTVPEGEVYLPVESPRGEMGYYVVSDGTAKPYRVHMRSPSFANLQTLAKMCEGRLIADVVAAIGSSISCWETWIGRAVFGCQFVSYVSVAKKVWFPAPGASTLSCGTVMLERQLQLSGS